jgi:hypothetical protein
LRAITRRDIDALATKVTGYNPRRDIDALATKVAGYNPRRDIDALATKVAGYNPRRDIDALATKVAGYKNDKPPFGGWRSESDCFPLGRVTLKSFAYWMRWQLG